MRAWSIFPANVRIEGVVTHPSSPSEPCMKVSPHTAPMTYGLKPAQGGKPFDYLYPAGTGGCGNLRLFTIPLQFPDSYSDLPEPKFRNCFYFLLGSHLTWTLNSELGYPHRLYLYSGIRYISTFRHPFWIVILLSVIAGNCLASSFRSRVLPEWPR